MNRVRQGHLDYIRKAITSIQTPGQTSNPLLLNPIDWETVSLLRTLAGTGQLEFGPNPTDAAGGHLLCEDCWRLLMRQLCVIGVSTEVEVSRRKVSNDGVCYCRSQPITTTGGLKYAADCGQLS